MAVTYLGNRGTATDKNGTTSYTLTTTSDIGAKSTVFFFGACIPNASQFYNTNFSVSGGTGTTFYSFGGYCGATSDRVNLVVAYCENGLAAGTIFTITWNFAPNKASVITAEEFAGVSQAVASGTYQTLGQYTSAGATTTTPSATTTLSVPSGNLVIGQVSANGPSGDSWTQDTDTVNGSWATCGSAGTTGAGAASNITIRGGYKVATGAGTQTYNPVLGTARASSESIWSFAFSPNITSSFTVDAVISGTRSSSFATDAALKTTYSGFSFTAAAYLKLTITSSLTASAAVLKTQSGSFTENAALKTTNSGSLTENAAIKVTQSGAFTDSAWIQIGGPTWVSPPDGTTVTAGTSLVWASVSSATNAHFHLQLDTSSAFTNAVEYFSSSTSGFEYWDGSSWVAISSTGVPANKTGNNVRFTPPVGFIGQTRYRRVRQSY